jgi:shikimate-5-dehydrogenase
LYLNTLKLKMSSEDIPPSKNFHIFGKGISFSVSPTIHNAGFKHYGLPFNYTIRESDSIDEVATLIADSQFGGASVTMPHKLQVHKFCNSQTETAKLIGAINTLIVQNNGSRTIIGDNTDWSGLHSIIAARTKSQPNTGLVIGAGGASRAALYAMHKAGIKTIYLVNRTLATAEKVKADFRQAFEIKVLADLSDIPEKPDVIIGTVPADTTTEGQFSGLFGSRGLCIDMSYKPRQTPLLTAAQKHAGWDTVTGVEVLLAQAFDQFLLWTGLEPPRDVMTEAIIALDKERAKGGML